MSDFVLFWILSQLLVFNAQPTGFFFFFETSSGYWLWDTEGAMAVSVLLLVLLVC